MSSVITLDVGGTLFKTSMMTLTSTAGCKEGHFFSRMFGGNWSNETNDKGAVWIDRDPQYFHLILNFLRNGDGIQLPEDVKDLKQLNSEAEFYGLTGLSNHIQKKLMQSNKRRKCKYELDCLTKSLDKMNALQQYCLLYEPNDYALKIIVQEHVTQLDRLSVNIAYRIGKLEEMLQDDLILEAVPKDMTKFSFDFNPYGLARHLSQLLYYKQMKENPEEISSFFAYRATITMYVFELKFEMVSLASYLNKPMTTL